MSETHLKDLNKSIELLASYHARLQKEVITIAKKLQMPPRKIDSTLESNPELVAIKNTIDQLIAHRDKQINQSRA